METFSALLALCAGNSSVTGEFPDKASDAELWCFLWSAPEWTIENNREASDLRRHRTHYDATVMVMGPNNIMMAHYDIMVGRSMDVSFELSVLN